MYPYLRRWIQISFWWFTSQIKTLWITKQWRPLPRFGSNRQFIHPTRPIRLVGCQHTALSWVHRLPTYSPKLGPASSIRPVGWACRLVICFLSNEKNTNFWATKRWWFFLGSWSLTAPRKTTARSRPISPKGGACRASCGESPDGFQWNQWHRSSGAEDVLRPDFGRCWVCTHRNGWK